MNDEQKLNDLKETIRQFLNLNVELLFTFKKETKQPIPTHLIKIENDALDDLQKPLPLIELIALLIDFHKSVMWTRGLYAVTNNCETFNEIVNRFNGKNKDLLLRTQQIVNEEHFKSGGHLYVVS